jgi:hypothetical protein
MHDLDTWNNAIPITAWSGFIFAVHHTHARENQRRWGKDAIKHFERVDSSETIHPFIDLRRVLKCERGPHVIRGTRVWIRRLEFVLKILQARLQFC